MKQSQPIVSLDSNTLVWGIRRKGRPDKVKHARYLFANLDKEEAQIIIPSVVVAEFVTPCKTSKEREAVIAEIGKRFVIAPFDTRAAAVAAELWNDGKNCRERKMKLPGARICLRADTLIVATAYAHGVQVFYTDDDACFSMAQKVIKDVRRLPIVGPHLWAEKEYSQEETVTRKPNGNEQPKE